MSRPDLGSEPTSSRGTIHPTDDFVDDKYVDEPTLAAMADFAPQVSSPVQDVGPPPDGGREAWCCAVCGGVLTFCLMGFVCSFGQLQEYYLANQLSSYPKSTVAWIGSVQACEVFIFSVLWGRIFDAHGARPLVISGSIFAIVGMFAMAFGKEYYQIFLAHFCFGFGSGLIWPTVTAIGGHWFSTRRGMAIGIIVGGSGLGGVVYPIMIKRLLRTMSFRNTLLIVAGMSAALMLPSWVLVKSRLPKRKPVPWSRLKHPWRDTRYAFFAIGCSFYMFNWMSPMFNAPIISRANEVSPWVTDYSIALMSAGGFFGRTISGLLADWLGVWNVFGTTSFLTAIVVFGFYVPCPIGDAAVVIGFLAYGWVSGAWLTLVSAVIASISPVEEVGLRIGIAWSVCGPTMVVGPVICGALISADNDRFTYAAAFCGATFTVSSFLAVGPRMLQVVGGRLWARDKTRV